MPTVMNADKNPLIVVSPDEVLAWLRKLADEAGYSDRVSSAIQVSYSDEKGTQVIGFAAPELILMVSGIPNSREKNPTREE